VFQAAEVVFQTEQFVFQTAQVVFQVAVRENSGTVIDGFLRDLLAIHQACYIRLFAVVK